MSILQVLFAIGFCRVLQSLRPFVLRLLPCAFILKKVTLDIYRLYINLKTFANSTSRLSMISNIIRWTARVIATLMFLFIGFIVAVYFIGDQEDAPRALSTIIPLAMILGGLIIGWKWELIGGLLTLGGCLIFVFQNWFTITGPYGICAFAAVLYIISWVMHKYKKPAAPISNTTPGSSPQP